MVSCERCCGLGRGYVARLCPQCDGTSWCKHRGSPPGPCPACLGTGSAVAGTGPHDEPAGLDEDQIRIQRFQLGLPRMWREPPDLMVHLMVPWSRVDEWLAQDGIGSADAAFALGVAEVQKGHLESANSLFTRAAERGSADGAFAQYVTSVGLGIDQEQGWALLLAADRAGSPEAALQVSQRLREVGDQEGADAAEHRALLRARVADQAGSADASWTLARVEPDEVARAAALQRAYERGVSLAAAKVGKVAQLSGDTRSAIRALTFATQIGGDGWAGVDLGDLRFAAGERRAARGVWLAACRLAVATGDEALYSLAKQRLMPPLRSVLARHKLAGALYVLALVALLSSGYWRWLVPALLAMLPVVFWQHRLRAGMLHSDPGEAVPDTPTFDAHGLSVAMFATASLVPGGAPAKTVVVSHSDVRRAAAGLLVVLVGGVVLTALWAGGVLTFRRIMDWGILSAAIVVAAEVMIGLPGAMSRRSTPESTAGDRDKLETQVKYSILPFTSVSLSTVIWDPRVEGLIEAARAARPAVQPLWAQRVQALIGATVSLVGAVALALPVLAPSRTASFGTVVHAAGAVATVWILTVCALRIQYALRRREPDWGIAATMYAALALAVATFATLLGVWDLL